MTNVIGVPVSDTSYDGASDQILSWAKDTQSRYICVATTHTIMEAHDSRTFNAVIDQADMVTPDGMPLVWMLRLKGAHQQQRVYGPTLMLHILQAAAQNGIPVGLYGSSPEVIQRLMARLSAQFTNVNIVYTFSPPFRELAEKEDDEIISKIVTSGLRILFVGLGCPKQELWMANHRGRIPAVMIGVGAAFDFHAGMKNQAPNWVQNIGMEWLFRLVHEPRRLWKRYTYHNPRFVFLAIVDLLNLNR